ncbi:MAG: hypothetical protein ACTFAK_03460 [Candidatus Electronema sp. VV]
MNGMKAALMSVYKSCENNKFKNKLNCLTSFAKKNAAGRGNKKYRVFDRLKQKGNVQPQCGCISERQGKGLQLYFTN